MRATDQESTISGALPPEYRRGLVLRKRLTVFNRQLQPETPNRHAAVLLLAPPFGRPRFDSRRPVFNVDRCLHFVAMLTAWAAPALSTKLTGRKQVFDSEASRMNHEITISLGQSMFSTHDCHKSL